MRKTRGFSLIELMVVIAVVSILATLAWPSYRDSIARSRREDGKIALTSASHALEKFFTERNTYVGATAGTTFPATSNDSNYTISFSSGPTATDYTVQAVPQGKQLGDSCGTFTLSAAGAKSVTGATLSSADCWGK